MKRAELVEVGAGIRIEFRVVVQEPPALQHRIFKGNFGAYDHWVPQFAVYAITAGTELDR